MMEAPPRAVLRLLLVEDNDDDALLVLRALSRADVEVTSVRAQTREEFLAALSDRRPDLIISDHSLPRFSSDAALACVRERGLDIPFIVVSGTLDEESAVSILKAGAHDFITKKNLARLGPAIRRELQEAKYRAERRAAQYDLRIQRDFFRLVIDANPALIFAKNAAGVFTLANRAVADLFGTTVDELVGSTLEGLLDRPPEPGFFTADYDVLMTGQARVEPAEAIQQAGTGTVRWFDTRVVPIVAPDGTPQVLGIGREITERRRAEEALKATEEQFRHAQKMEAVGQLAGGIAHDFNNLLTAILCYSQLVKDRIQDPEMLSDVDEILKAGERAESLTRQLLAFSRKQILEPQTLNLPEVVEEIEKLLRRVIGETIELKTSSSPSVPTIRADKGQIEQMLLNLAINARDAMPGGGTLTITVRNTASPQAAIGDGQPACGQWVTLTVADTGSGIAPEIRDRIFEPFFTTKGPGKGTGLGLAVVYGVVTQSGGAIAVDSEPDRGTRFTISFPATNELAPGTPDRDNTKPELGGTETILLVEDEVPIRELVRKVLSAYGYSVLEAPDPHQAIRIAQRHEGPLHLLLTDIAMPRLNGPELAQRLVVLRPEVRVLYMSGFAGTISDGIDVLLKPFTPERLALRVRESLARDWPAQGSRSA